MSDGTQANTIPGRRDVKVVEIGIKDPKVLKVPSVFRKKDDFAVAIEYRLVDATTYVGLQRFDRKKDAVAFIERIGDGEVPRNPTWVEYRTDDETGVERMSAIRTEFRFGA